MKFIKYLLLVAFIISACAKEEILVTIGDENYTFNDFKDRYQFAPTDDSLKRLDKFNDFINQMLVIHEARAKGYEKDQVVGAAFETNRKDIIARGYYEEQVINKIKISDYEAKKLYDKFVDQYHLGQIVVPTESLAQHIGNELKKGVLFDSLLKFSLDTLTENGDIGTFSTLSLPPEILNQVKKTKIGATTESVKFGQYFYFLKVIEHKKADTPKFDEIKEDIKNSLLREKAMAEGEKFTNRLIENAKIEYNQEGLDALIKPDSLITEEDLKTWVIKKYDTAYVYVKTIIEALRYQYQRSGGIDPKQLIDRVLFPDLLYDAALKAKAENLPTIKNNLKKALATLIYQKFYSDVVLANVVIDSVAVKDYFRLYRDEYKDKKFNEVYTLISAKIREAKVDSLRRNLFEELRKKYNPTVNEKTLAKLLKEEK